MYQLQRDYFVCSSVRNREIVKEIAAEDKKNREKFIADLTGFKEDAEKYMRSNDERLQNFKTECKSIYEMAMFRTNFELNQLRNREKRRSENRRAKRLRKKQRQAEAKKANDGSREENEAGEE